MTRYLFSIAALLCAVCATTVYLSGCGTTASTASTSAATSASAVAAGSVGSALANSSSTQTPSRSSSRTVCPTIKTGVSGTNCTNVDATHVVLHLDNCSYPNATAVWNGYQELHALAGVTNLVCGTFPTITSSGSAQLGHLFSNAGGTTGGSATRVGVGGRSVTIDTGTAGLGNYQGDTIDANRTANEYGESVGWSNGARVSVDVTMNVIATGFFNHTVTTASTASIPSASSLQVTETAGATSRTVAGTVGVYHNLLKVVAATTFSTVKFEDTCCYPVSGSISTAFTKTSLSGAAGIALNGKTESLTFTGCGTATYVDSTGSSASVTMDTCL